MSTTDTRSGFRLPWSSDRSRDDGTPDDAASAEGASAEVDATSPADDAASMVSDGSEAGPDEAWPDIDVGARLHDNSVEASMSPPASPEPAPMPHPAAAPTPAAVATPKKPSKLMGDLVAAMRATAEVAREQAQSQLDADARQVMDDIRKGSADGVAALRERSDEDIARIREWSKAEIARVREETDRKVSERKASLEQETAAHAADIERRVGLVQAAVAAYEADMTAFFERLLGENDPARLATMAESMPEPPSMTAFAEGDAPAAEAGVDPLVPVGESPTADVAGETGAEALVEIEAETETRAAAGAEAQTEVEPEAGVPEADEWSAAEDAAVELEAAAVELEAAAAAGEAWAQAEAEAEPVPAPKSNSFASSGPWGGEDGLTGAFAATGTSGPGGNPDSAIDDDADVARWAADPGEDAPSGTDTPAGTPVDRGSIMAALEAAAEAVVAAEAAAESADQAEAAADVAETAAELIVGRADADEEAEHEAEAALAARMDAGGLEREPSLADRLASLLPGAGSAEGDATPTTTQVVVTGLVSVASIASFKRHLGRAHGVQSVTVASGPDGEFVFNVTHRTDSGLREAIPALPGFGARVTGTGDGVLSVTARDPEAEG